MRGSTEREQGRMVPRPYPLRRGRRKTSSNELPPRCATSSKVASGIPGESEKQNIVPVFHNGDKYAQSFCSSGG
ncbi:unnamed protein product [Lampetra planeri]